MDALPLRHWLSVCVIFSQAMKSFAIFMGLNCFFKNEGAKVVFQE
jgi:hypothetical protein